MHQEEIRVVCFDLGRVIVRICSSWEEACLRAGLPSNPRLADPETGAKIRLLDDAWQRGAMSVEEYVRSVAAALDGIYQGEEVRRIHDAWLLGEYAGMDFLVRSIGVTTTCLSNTNQRHWELMQAEPARFPAFHALDLRLASHLLGLVKPSPEIFERFESLTGSSGLQIVFFDDCHENVRAARSFGWRAHWVDPERNPYPQVMQALEQEGIRLPSPHPFG